MTEARVSVILVAYYGDDWLPECLRTLAAASENQLHLVLVDNAGNQGLDALPLDPFDAEVIATDRPLGFAEANNFALVRASRLAEYVLFLNQDTVSPPGWIDAALAAFADPGIGAISPLIRNYDDTGWDPSFVACLSEQEQQRLEEPDSSYIIEVNKAPAPALFVRTDVLRRTGPFDPIYGSYYEDYDLCRRIRRAGFRIAFAAQARVQHFSGSTTQTPEAERRRMRQIIRNRFIYDVRGTAAGRGAAMFRRATSDLPRRLIRGLLRTHSSQPPAVTLGAYRDLLPLLGRLTSDTRDRRSWERYLDSIGWPREETRTTGVQQVQTRTEG